MRKGFTLIEIMIVVVILALLATLVVPNIIGQGERAKQKIVCVQMKSLKDALDSFKIEEGTYPSTQEGLEALIKNPNPKNIKITLKKDFWVMKNYLKIRGGMIIFM